MDPTPTIVSHKAFMKPPNFSGKEGPDLAEEWLREIKKAFNIIEVLDRLRVRFGTYMLIEDAEA